VRIAVTASGPTLQDPVDPRFGRCAYFLVVDTESMRFEALENPNISLGGGAGIQSAQFLANQGVGAVLTGNCGPNAFQTLKAAGIALIAGVAGSVSQAVERFRTGELRPAAEPSVASHFGMGGGMGAGGGRGMGGGGRMGGGRGMGMGIGRGMRGGAGIAAPAQEPPSRAATPSPRDEAEDLATVKEQARRIQEQLDRALQRIDELERGKK